MAEVLQFPFARGIDEGSDPKALTPGTPLVMTNRVLDKTGRTRKRYGVNAKKTAVLGGGAIATGGDAIPTGKRLVTRGDDLAVFDGEKLYEYGNAVAKWTAVDRPPPLMARKRSLIHSSRSVQSVDIAISGDMLITVYETGLSGTSCAIFVQVTSLSTGEMMLAPTVVSTAAKNPRVLIAGTSAVILVSQAANIGAFALPLATLVLAAGVNVVTNARAVIPTPFDAVVRGAVLYLAYETTTQVAVVSVATGALGGGATATINYAGTGITAICLDVGGANVYVAWALAGGLQAAIATTALVAVVGPVTAVGGTIISMFIAEYDSATVLIGWTKNTSAGQSDKFETATYSVAALAQDFTSLRTTFGFWSASKAWSVAGRWYVMGSIYLHPYDATFTATDAVPQASTLVLEIETANSLTGSQNASHPQVATLENLTGWRLPTFNVNQFPTVILKPATDAAGNVYIPSPVRGAEPLNAYANVPTGWTLHRLSVGGGDLFRSAVSGAAALIASAAPAWYDGATARPYGFAHAPLLTEATSVAGGSMVVGTYGYVAVYVWPDANGIEHRSLPSPPKTGTAAGGNLSLRVTAATASVSRKSLKIDNDSSSLVRVELHRTEKGGADYYKHARPPVYNVLLNDGQINAVQITDTRADASITGTSPTIALSTQPQLYSANALDDAPPPAALTVLSHKDRLWLIASDGHTVWPSKAASEDPDVAPGFNEALTLYFAREKNALGPLDESLIVLGPDSIDIVGGLGPDNQGNGAWAQAAVQSDVGCINPRSVVAIPQGLVFQSRRSLEILTRERTLGWFGQAVQDTLDAYPTITSAVVVPGQHQVRFTCNKADLSSGRVLVFDYVRSAWSTFDYGFAVEDAALVAGTYTMLRYTGVVLQEDTTTHLDNGVYVASAVEMPISPSGPNAWHRVKDVQVLGTSVTNHNLTIRVRRDFADAYEQTQTFAAEGVVTAIGPLENARMTLARQKGQGFSFRVEDSAPTTGALGIGAGPLLEGLALYVQRKAGLPKVSAGRKG